MRHFIHSGDLGDVIYSLPTVKAMGGGVMHLIDVPGMTAHGMTLERAKLIESLLKAQPYIQRVEFGGRLGTDEGDSIVDLNTFRYMPRDLCNEWLPNHYLDVHHVHRSAAYEPWLTVDGLGCPTGVLIARSARYHNPRFPWRRVVEQYRDYAMFIGTPVEHAAFNLEFDADLPHLLTDDLLEVAEAINACTLFVGNQSCPLAIAEGLKVPVICEVCPYCPNCISPRADFWAGRDEHLILPDLENLNALCQ